MSHTVDTIPPRLREIIEDFSMCEGQEKLELLLEFAEKLPPLPDWLADKRDAMDQVHECMTPVFLHAEYTDYGLEFYFDVPLESTTPRGYASVLQEGLHGTTPEQVLAIPADFYHEMGLHNVLTPQRLNGISAMLAYVKRLATQQISNGSG